MKRLFAAAFLVDALAGPASAADRIWTVDDVHRHAWELHGKVVNVRGWLPRCDSEDCTLFNSNAEADTFRAYKDQLLEIGSSRQFDSSVAGKLPAEILLRAKVDATCIEPRTIKRNGQTQRIICFDRVDELTPLEIIQLRRAIHSMPPKL